MDKNSLILIFIGSSRGIQVPSFHCSCRTCEKAKKISKLRRTRASIVLSGLKNVLIDVSLDIEFQLEREEIKFLDRIFLTHWHYDHCFGLGAFPELGTHGIWEKSIIDLYLPEQDLKYFENLGFSRAKFLYNPHPLKLRDLIKLPDFMIEAVKTNHTFDCVGYIITTPNKKFAYLVDSVIPPVRKIGCLKEFDLDFVILEGTSDKLILPRGMTIEQWKYFSIFDAVVFWKSLNVPKCILTHTSFHSWNINNLIAGITFLERKDFEKRHPGLEFAYDGLRMV